MIYYRECERDIERERERERERIIDDRCCLICHYFTI